MALVLVVIIRLQTFSSVICQIFVQHFTRFQLTACSRGPLATAGLLVLKQEIMGWRDITWTIGKSFAPRSRLITYQHLITLASYRPGANQPTVGRQVDK